MQVEIGVVGQVQHRRSVGRSRIVDPELIIHGHGINHFRSQRTRKILFSVRRNIDQFERLFAGIVGKGAGVPHFFTETDDPPVQRIRAVVDSQRILFAVEREFPVGDPVRITPGDGSGKRIFRYEIIGQFRVPQHDVLESAVFGRNPYVHDNPAVIGDLRCHSVGILQRIERHRLTVDRRVEIGRRVERRLSRLRLFTTGHSAQQRHAQRKNLLHSVIILKVNDRSVIRLLK